jgi:ferric enterobactin receptor
MTSIQGQNCCNGPLKRWLVASFLLAPSLIFAQAVRDISGYVRDGDTGEALPHASVLLDGTKLGAATNTDGYFVIVNAPTANRKLQIRYIGYATGKVELDSTTTRTAPLEIYLKPIVYELAGITVQGEAQTIEAADKVSEVVLAPAQLRSMPNLGEVDVFRSLQLLPGISGVSDGSSGLYVRGGTPDENLVLFDGMTIYHVDHFFGMFSAFNADAIKDIRVYKGGYPAEFGGRVSSVVNLTGKTGSSSDYRYGVGLNLLSGNGLLEIPLHDKGSLLVSLRRSYTDVIQSGLYNKLFDFKTGDDGVQTAGGPGGGGGPGGTRRGFTSVSERPDFYFYDFNTKLTLTPTDKDILSLSFYRGKDNLDQSQDLSGNNFSFRGGGNNDFVVAQDISRQREELTTWGNTGVSGKWARRIHDRLYSSAMASYSSYFSTYDRSTSFSGSTLADSVGFFRGGGAATNEDNEVEDLTVRLDNEFHVSNSHDLKFGLGVSMFNSHYYTALNDTTQLLALDTKSRQANFYLQDMWSISPNLELTIGGRGVHYDKTSKLYLEPRASLMYSLSERVKLKGAWGHYHQFVNRISNENVLEGGRDFWLLADEEMTPNFAEHYIGGASYETDDFLFDVEGYYKDLDDLLEYTRRVQYVFRNGRREEVGRGFFQGQGSAKGIDVLLQKKRGKLNGWLGYSYGKVEHTFPDFNSGLTFPASHDRTHEINLVGKYRLGDWELAATWVYATGKAYTAPISQYYVDLLDGSEFSYIHVSDKNSQRLPNYHRLDFSISRSFYFDTTKWVAGFSLFNLYNNKNVWYRQYDLDVQPVAVTDVTMLGFTPTVFVQIYSH